MWRQLKNVKDWRKEETCWEEPNGKGGARKSQRRELTSSATACARSPAAKSDSAIIPRLILTVCKHIMQLFPLVALSLFLSPLPLHSNGRNVCESGGVKTVHWWSISTDGRFRPVNISYTKKTNLWNVLRKNGTNIVLFCLSEEFHSARCT